MKSETKIHNWNRERPKKETKHKVHINIYNTRGPAPVGRKPLAVRAPTALSQWSE